MSREVSRGLKSRLCRSRDRLFGLLGNGRQRQIIEKLSFNIWVHYGNRIGHTDPIRSICKEEVFGEWDYFALVDSHWRSGNDHETIAMK